MEQKILFKFKDKELLKKDIFNYKTFNILPSRTIESNKSLEDILTTMSAVTDEKFKFDHLTKSIIYSEIAPFYYEILYENGKINFYYILADKYSKVVSSKIDNSFRTATIIEQEDYFKKFKNCYYCNFSQSKHFLYSLNSDYRESLLLEGLVGILNSLQKDDSVLMQIAILPIHENKWKEQWKTANIKQRNGEELTVHLSPISFAIDTFFKTSESLLDIFDYVVGVNTKENEKVQRQMDKMGKWKNASMTTQKISFNGYDIRLRIYCTNEYRVRYYGKLFDGVFKVLDADQTLEMGKIKRHKKSEREFDIQFNKQIWSIREVANFLKLPDRKIQFDYRKGMNSIQLTESEVPDDLQNGIMCIGTNLYHGVNQKAYLSTDKEYQQLLLVLIGPTRSGKSVLISNLAKNAIEHNECCIIFDFIENCELSVEIANVFPKEKVMVIECGDISKIQGLGYNEVGINKDKFIQYDNAKKQTTQLLALINSINTGDKTLQPRMERYLMSSAIISFIQEGSIKTVFEVLTNHQVREQYIHNIPLNQQDNLEEYLSALDELNEVDKNGNIIGTKYSYITGILDRLQKLKSNTYMELMLKKGTENNINLIDELQKSQLICLRMPESMFATDQERDIYCVYWMTKLWLSLQLRAERFRDKKDRVKVNLFIDELYQVNHTEEFLTEKLSRLAKFRLKPIISCHYLNQIKGIRDELRSANASYMLLSGCDKNNFNELKEELDPYEMDDLLKLPRYHSLNLIKCKEGYSKFITKLPKPIK